MNTEFPLRKLSTPLAREVSELLLLKADLERSVEGFKLWGAISQNEEPEQKQFASALFRDSVITLTSCFDAASPFNLKVEEVYGTASDGSKYFRWLKDLRDTWIAHRHGPLRFAAYGYFIHPETGDVAGEGQFVAVYQSADSSESPVLVHFTQIALSSVEKRLGDLIPKLRTEIDAIYPSTRLKLDIATAIAPGPNQLRVGRRKYEAAITQRKRDQIMSRDESQQARQDPKNR